MENEVRLIDAKAFYETLEEIRMEYLEEDTMSSNFAAAVLETVQDCYLKDAPTIDPKSLRPKGRWANERILVGGHAEVWGCDCSVCGKTVRDHKYNYCPNCGANMEG